MTDSQAPEIIDEMRHSLPGHSANKPVYLIQVKSGNTKREYVSFKLTYKPATLKLQGWKISSKATVNNLEDAEKHAEREDYFDIEFPWHKIESIRNLTFKR